MTAISDAYYCTECTRLEKDRDGCPKIINVRQSSWRELDRADEIVGSESCGCFLREKEIRVSYQDTQALLGTQLIDRMQGGFQKG